MGQFQRVFIGFMIIGLIVYGMFSFITTLQEENNIDNKFIDNSLINQTFSGLKTNLTDYGDQGQSQKTLFESENPTAGLGTILLFSIVSAGKIFNGMVISTFNLLIKLPVVFLGLDPIIVSVLSTILIITIIMGLWIVYKLGG